MVGDVVIVDSGMEIPSDGILIESSEITADESAMTGIKVIYIRGDFTNQ